MIDPNQYYPNIGMKLSTFAIKANYATSQTSIIKVSQYIR